MAATHSHLATPVQRLAPWPGASWEHLSTRVRAQEGAPQPKKGSKDGVLQGSVKPGGRRGVMMEEGFPHMGTGPDVLRRRALLGGGASKRCPCSPQPCRPWQNAHSPEDRPGHIPPSPPRPSCPLQARWSRRTPTHPSQNSPRHRWHPRLTWPHCPEAVLPSSAPSHRRPWRWRHLCLSAAGSWLRGRALSTRCSQDKPA